MPNLTAWRWAPARSLMVYDLDQLVPVTEDADKLMAFVFKNPDRKPETLLGVRSILGTNELVG